MSSRIWCCLAITLSILITGCIPQAHPRDQTSVQTAVRTETEVIEPIVTGKSTLVLNVREKASSKTAVVDKLSKNTQVEILDKSGSWYKN